MTEINFRDVQKGLRRLGLDAGSHVLAHVDLAALGAVRGGPEAVAGALVSLGGLVLMPAFSEACQIVPPVGPPNNGLTYGDHSERNSQADFFQLDLPVQPDLGPVAEAFRRLPTARRSSHPLLSFAALGPRAEIVLNSQTLAEPWGPVARLAELGGQVLLLGADQRANVALHLAAQRAGRPAFVRWALTPAGIVACPHYPGCSDGFEAIAARLLDLVNVIQIGPALAQVIPLAEMLRLAEAWLKAEPLALVCGRPECERCQAIQLAVSPQNN